MLKLAGSDENQNTGFKFIGMDNQSQGVRLISDNISLIISDPTDGCLDTCSFYSGPSDAAIIAFGESSETTGIIAYSDGSSYSSSTYSGCESAGCVASSSTSYSSSSGSGSSYSISC